MRYVCYKTIVRKVIDESIDDLASIKSVLKVFCDKELTCALQVGSGPMLSPCRVCSTSDNNFQFVAFRRYGTLRKTAKYEDIGYLELQTDDETIALFKPNVTRWTLLDADGLGSSDSV
jgi:hypothetical protein